MSYTFAKMTWREFMIENICFTYACTPHFRNNKEIDLEYFVFVHE